MGLFVVSNLGTIRTKKHIVVPNDTIRYIGRKSIKSMLVSHYNNLEKATFHTRSIPINGFLKI